MTKFFNWLKKEKPTQKSTNNIGLTEEKRKELIRESLKGVSIKEILDNPTSRQVNPEAIKSFCEAFNKVAKEDFSEKK